MEPRRPYKLALFDLDGTLTRERSAWEYVHRRLGLWEGQAEKFQESFLGGKIDYLRFCELDAQVWKGIRAAYLEGILREIPFHPGLGELVGYLKSKGLKLGIISSGLSFLSEWVKGKFGFDYAVANELGTSDGLINGGIRIHVHYDRKEEWVRAAQRRFGAGPGETMAVGDSAGDLPMFRLAGLSIAFNAHSPQLESAASLVVRSADLRDLISALIPYLGPPGEPADFGRGTGDSR